MTDLKPCPFCGSADLHIDTEPFVESPKHSYWVHCNSCSVEGSIKRTEAAAIAAWNQRASGWRDIADAPKDGTDILLFESGFADPADGIHIGWFDQVAGFFDSLPRIDNPTHWMPLPLPPEPAEKGKG